MKNNEEQKSAKLYGLARFIIKRTEVGKRFNDFKDALTEEEKELLRELIK